MKNFVLNIGSETGETLSRDTLYGAWCKGKKVGFVEYPPLALLSVNTFLNNNGFETIFLDAQGEKIIHKELLNKYDWKEFDTLITQTSTMTFRGDLKLLKAIKERNKDIKIIVCGSHVTFMPEHSSKNDVIDFLVQYEPEDTVLELIKKISSGKDKIPRISGVQGEYVNEEDLPIVDRKPILKIHYYNPLVKEEKWTTMETTRGCPSRCTFCTAPYFFGKNIRKRSVEDLIKEMKYLKNLGYKEIAFRDEIFTYDRRRVKEICELMIKEKLNLKWICNGKIGMCDKPTMEIMKKAGCHLLLFGVESGSQRVLDAIKKDQTIEQIENTFRWANEVGIDTHAHFLIGSPGETEEEIEQTIAFSKKIKPTTAAFGILTVYPGSALHDDVKDKLPDDWDGTEAEITNLHVRSFQNGYFTQLSPETIEKYLMKAYKEFYTRPSYIAKRIFNINSLHEMFVLGKSGLGVIWMVLTREN
tara:strand:+ start:2728 stop:4143 length:1416 start_codon:yes stop_codon:yes gene_type:complete